MHIFCKVPITVFIFKNETREFELTVQLFAPARKLLPPTNEVCEGYVLHVSVCPQGGSAPRGYLLRGVPAPGVPAPGGMPALGGSCFGGCLLQGGCSWGAATAAGGTHPTGTHSCFWMLKDIDLCFTMGPNEKKFLLIKCLRLWK